MKHTKGNWETKETSGVFDIYCYIHMHGDVLIGTIYKRDQNDRYFGTEEAEANAKLIAAAPEMLEALQWIEHHALQKGCNKESLKAVAKEAIKKATE